MHQSEADSDLLPDGRPRWALSPEERAALAREERATAIAAAEADAERWRTRETKIDAAVKAKLSAGLPAASELGVNAAGLPPARSRLVVGLKWLEIERSKIPGLEQRRDAFLLALGASDRTRHESAQVKTAVGDAVRAFYASGSRPDSPPDLRKAERDELIERLAREDELVAEISGGLLENAEIEIEGQQRIVAELEKRRAVWISYAVEEVGLPVGVRIEALMAELVKELAVATALASVIEHDSDLRHVRNGATLSAGIALPWCAPTMPVPGGATVWKIADEWRAIRSTIEKDARAQVSPPKAREIVGEQSIFAPEPVAEVAPIGILKRVVQAVRPASPKLTTVPAMDEGMQFNNYSGPL